MEWNFNSNYRFDKIYFYFENKCFYFKRSFYYFKLDFFCCGTIIRACTLRKVVFIFENANKQIIFQFIRLGEKQHCQTRVERKLKWFLFAREMKKKLKKKRSSSALWKLFWFGAKKFAVYVNIVNDDSRRRVQRRLKIEKEFLKLLLLKTILKRINSSTTRICFFFDLPITVFLAEVTV